ncbi:hypothetical protein Ga0466249_005042 [Sporomusaceae bacterium BoRhaA]|nr:hypothetical protein [Pelorhabdus rhamnosifermentans]
MKKISTFDFILLFLFIVWVSALDFYHLTVIEEVGLVATVVYIILTIVKVMKK